MSQAVDWTLSRATHTLKCVAEATSAGAVRLSVYMDDLAVRIRLCRHASEAAELSRHIRREWEGCGWSA